MKNNTVSNFYLFIFNFAFNLDANEIILFRFIFADSRLILISAAINFTPY